jgi:purine-binding chemotaxis protein CheW
MNTTTDAKAPTQYLSFFVAGEEYAIGVLQAKEIVEYTILTKVPNTPRSIRGVINLRGSVVPVVDLAVKFGYSETPVTKRTCIVIVEIVLGGEPMVMGVLADSVSQVVELQADEIEPPPPFGTQAHFGYLQGMAKSGKKFVLLLNIAEVISTDDLLAHASSQQPGGDETKRPRRSHHNNPPGDTIQTDHDQPTVPAIAPAPNP